VARLRVLITGASGLIGSALATALEARGDEVVRLGRSARAGSLRWDPARGLIPGPALEGLDAAVHLAGASLAAGRWSAAVKGELLASRVRGTRLLAETLVSLTRPPRVLISASAIGYFGDRGDDVLSEESAPGAGFLAALVQSWEREAAAAEQRAIRVVRLRMGLVLTTRGGVLARMLPPFRLGLGGAFGSGRQWMSWITLDDVLRVVRLALDDAGLEGALHAVAPGAVTNREFARTLARVLHRPAPFDLPAPLLRWALGEMADQALLASTRVEPRRLLQRGFAFLDPELEPALRRLLAPAAATSS
jgi:uncharacterized protein (TIGR01777 family)